MRIKLLGKVWTLIRKPLVAADGYCDHPQTNGKKIIVDSRLRGERELEVLIHEFMHAADWTKDESWIEPVAEDVARALWRLGYRRE